MQKTCIGFLAGSLLGGVCLSVALGQDHSHEIIDHTPEVHKWAIPSYNNHYFGYWVGGGAFSRRKGHAPAYNEGTWGWDFRGWLIPRRVDLLWLHGRRYQGGSGAYRTDGPFLPHLPHAEGHENGHENGYENGHGNGHEKGGEKH